MSDDSIIRPMTKPPPRPTKEQELEAARRRVERERQDAALGRVLVYL